MATFGNQNAQRLIERFAFLRIGPSHLFLSSGLTLRTNFQKGSPLGVKSSSRSVQWPAFNSAILCFSALTFWVSPYEGATVFHFPTKWALVIGLSFSL